MPLSDSESSCTEEDTILNSKFDMRLVHQEAY